jgi:hypothetical protein
MTRYTDNIDERAQRLIDWVAQEKDRDHLQAALTAEDLIGTDFFLHYTVADDSTQFKFQEMKCVRADLYHVFWEDEDGMPYRLVMQDDGIWRGQALQFFCMGCFEDDPTCGVCGGSGWCIL